MSNKEEQHIISRIPSMKSTKEKTAVWENLVSLKQKGVESYRYSKRGSNNRLYAEVQDWGIGEEKDKLKKERIIRFSRV